MNIFKSKLTPSILVFIMSVSAGFSAKADDTEIFFGGISSSFRSNVLFILDTSGSMSDEDCTGSWYNQVCQPTRMERMKSAFQSLLTNMNNINVGLMRYNSPGGPILYPVTDIDSVLDASAIAVHRVSASENDAEETNTGTVTLNSNTLALSTRISSPGGTEIIPVSTGVDDAEELVATNTINNISSPGLEIPYDNYTINDTNEHRFGVIFRNLNIPKDALILEAYVSFEIETKVNSDADFSDPVILDIKGQENGTINDFSSTNIASRTTTTATTLWTITDSPAQGESMQTPDISVIVSEIVSDATWTSGNDLALFFERNAADTKTGYREFSSIDGGTPPTITIIYETPASSTTQTVGLRFTDVKIPKGASITSATLQFNSAGALDGTAALTIYGENSGDAAPFTTASNNISSRTRTNTGVSWTPSPWSPGEQVTTADDGADVTDIIQEIVNHADWCGGQDLAFIIGGSGSRYANSFDGDSATAPLLKVEYDTTNIGSGDGCILLDSSYRISSDNDDAEQETAGSKDFTLNRDELTLEHFYEYSTRWRWSCFCYQTSLSDDYNQAIGLRFTNVDIPQGSTIEEAYLEFTASSSQNSAMSSVSINVENANNANTFQNQTGRKILDRTYFSNTVNWSGLSNWVENESYQTPSVKSLVQLVVNNSGWNANNALVFKLTGSGANFREAYAYNGNPLKAPRLVLKVRGTTSSSSGVTTRDVISSLVEDFTPSGATPIVDVLYEAALYFRGEDVYWGKMRGNSSARTESRKFYRLSHPSSYTGGTVYRPNGCSESNLNDTDCIDSYIDGSPVYNSPIDNQCSTNHIVLLTDGLPTVNESVSEIETMIGKSCSQSGDSKCANDLASFLYNTDHSNVGLIQNIKVHTIAFNSTDSATFLSEMASNGGGFAKSASTSDELLTAFEEILTENILNDTTFVSPGITVNAFNELTHRNELYFALFSPEQEPSWPGNLKRYKLGNTGDIIDVNGNNAIDPDSGFFTETAKSWWSNTTDGNSAESGGAASSVPSYSSRNMYTYYAASGSPNLSNTVNAFVTTNSAITKDMLSISTESDEYRTNLMNWFRGKDVLDADGDGVTDEDRKRFADPLHSIPHIVTYGGTDDAPDITIYYGDNEGLLHAIDSDTGVELFSFIPEALLGNIDVVFNNSKSSDHPYGLDGSLNSWVKDVDGDKQIEPADGDHVYIYIGMRRGGRNYYALDVTDRNNPRMLWTIEGGSGSFTELGQSWSRPVKTKININGTVTDVLIFSGGYDSDQDNVGVITADNVGRAVYIVNAATGALIWNAGPSGANLNISEMNYSIPGDIRVIDVNNDGLADQMYVGDVGGQLLRFDITQGENVNNLITGGVIADISGNTQATARRFYHEPEVGLITESNTYKLAILIGSGYRAHPLNDAVNDRAYMFKQTDVFGPPASAGQGQGPTYVKMTEADLYDATANLVLSDDEAIAATALASTQAADGWYIKMQAKGEKVLSTPLLINGMVYFTTYAPETSSSTSCAVRNGTSRLYSSDVLTGGNSKTVINTSGIPGNPIQVKIPINEPTPEPPTCEDGAVDCDEPPPCEGEDCDSNDNNNDTTSFIEKICVGTYCIPMNGSTSFVRTYWYTN